MPELPEVETVCRGLSPVVTGRVVTFVEQRRADLRKPFPAHLVEKLAGRRVQAVRRRAKYIVIDLDDGHSLLIHLGMSGRMVIVPWQDDFVPQKHDHFIMGFDRQWRVVFHDPRRFGLVDWLVTADHGRHVLLKDIGPEPLGNEFSPAILAAGLAGRRSPIKAALLDQRIVAGLGNIYVSEALFRARIDPRRLAASLTRAEIDRLVPAIRGVLQAAIAAGGSSLRDYVQASEELGYFQTQFAVYDRAGLACPDCDCDRAETGGIQRLVQANRSTFFCPRKQQ